MVSQDMRLGHTILAADDSRLKDQMQADAPVQKIGPVYRDLRLHARLESIARAKSNILTAYHTGRLLTRTYM